jgi:NAD(P)H-hydrate epimerase
MKGAFHFAVEGAKASGTSLIVGLGDFYAPDEVVMVKDRQSFLSKKLKSIVVGPGLGTFEFDLTGIETPIVIDADALKRIGGKKFRSNAVLTPHRGEAKALLNQEIEDPFKSALELAEKFEAFVLLKGPGSILASPEGVGYVFTRPNPNLSVGGSGDVLAGYIGGLIAAGLSPFDALKRAVLDQGSVPTRPTFVSAFEIANHLRSVST